LSHEKRPHTGAVYGSTTGRLTSACLRRLVG
jgi:hypothetical protein